MPESCGMMNMELTAYDMNYKFILLELLLSFRISSIRFALPASSMDKAKSLIWSVSSSVKSIIINCNACCSRTWWFRKYRSLQSLLSVVFGLMSAPRTGWNSGFWRSIVRATVTYLPPSWANLTPGRKCFLDRNDANKIVDMKSSVRFIRSVSNWCQLKLDIPGCEKSQSH